jgi:hypothetical protein
MQQIDLNQSSASLRRILFVCALPAARDEVQRINLGDVGTGDTFTLTYSGQTTSAISWNATEATTASNIDTALEALSNIDASAITVAHVSAQIYAVTFGGNLASTDVALLTITPTGFTPTGITEYQHGGVDGAPARGVVFAAAEISVSKNGATAATSAGTVTEIGDGRYYYEATAGEVDTLGFLSLATLRTDVEVRYPTVQIVQPAQGSSLLRSGTAQGGAPGSITLDSSASAQSNFYVPSIVRITSNTGAGQAPRYMYAYNGTSKVASIEPEWTIEPDNTSLFEVEGTAPLIVDVVRSHHTTAGTFGDVATPEQIGDEVVPRIIADSIPFDGADIADLQSRLPAALVSGRMASDAIAISGSTAAADKLESHTASVLQVVIDTGSTSSAIILDAATGINGGAPSVSNDIYNGRVLVITSGAAVGQATTISDYVGATRTLTVTALTTAPGNDDTAVIV